MSDGPVALARTYYRALDEHEYETLAELLAEEFVHDRPDMTLDGADRFVEFMREERPQTDTTHRVDDVFTDDDGGEVAIRGRLLTADGNSITGFVDVFTVGDGGLHRIETYTN